MQQSVYQLGVVGFAGLLGYLFVFFLSYEVDFIALDSDLFYQTAVYFFDKSAVVGCDNSVSRQTGHNQSVQQ